MHALVVLDLHFNFQAGAFSSPVCQTVYVQ